MTALKSGELFAGAGGLGMAVDEVFGSNPAWFCEFDPAPSRVLAHHFPDVPNYGDVTKVNWATAPYVDILAGGFPCQDVSLAGARRGMKDGTRSGLWSEYVKAIDTLRPDWVVIENVRGLISARADSEVEPCPWCVGDGDDEYHLRALDAVLADLSRLGFDAEWAGLRAADVGAPHGRFRFFILAWPAERTVAQDADGRRGRWGTAASGPGEGAWADAPADRADSRADGTPARTGPPADADDRAGDGERTRAELGFGGAEADLILLPTPAASEPGFTFAPVDSDGQKPGHGAQRWYHPVTARLLQKGVEQVVMNLLLTPQVADGTGGHATRSGDRADERLLPGAAVDAASGWGPYATAIARWETAIGRPAPSPVRMDGKGGKARLNPELTEWMMGWPAGWVTASAQLSRAEQLKACGNGVVPQQAAAALRMLLARPGVPTIRQAVPL